MCVVYVCTTWNTGTAGACLDGLLEIITSLVFLGPNPLSIADLNTHSIAACSDPTPSTPPPVSKSLFPEKAHPDSSDSPNSPEIPQEEKDATEEEEGVLSVLDAGHGSSHPNLGITSELLSRANRAKRACHVLMEDLPLSATSVAHSPTPTHAHPETHEKQGDLPNNPDQTKEDADHPDAICRGSGNGGLGEQRVRNVEAVKGLCRLFLDLPLASMAIRVTSNNFS